MKRSQWNPNSFWAIYQGPPEHHLALVHPKSQKTHRTKKRFLRPLRRIFVVFKTPPPPSPVEIRWQFRVVSAQRQGRYPVTKTRKYMISRVISPEIIRLKGDILTTNASIHQSPSPIFNNLFFFGSSSLIFDIPLCETSPGFGFGRFTRFWKGFLVTCSPQAQNTYFTIGP